jgi:hypothetical protein
MTGIISPAVIRPERCDFARGRLRLVTALLCLAAASPGRAQPLPPEVARFQAEMLRKAQAEALAEAAANDKVGGKWRGVPRIKGTATVYYRSTIDEADLQPSEVSLREEEVTLRFELVRDDTHGSTGLIWRAREASLAGGKSAQSTFVSGDTNMRMTEDGRFRGPPAGLKELNLDLSTEDGRWHMLTPGFTQDKYVVTRHWNGQRSQGGGWVAVNERETEEDNRVQSMLFQGTIGDQPAMTVGTYVDEGIVAQKPSRRFLKRGRIEFWPEFDDYALEVTIEDYAKWRPLGVVAAPDKPGNNLTAKATVINKGGGEPAQVKTIRFALIDASREPGVCLNWPLGATDRNPDLKLAVAPECPGTVSQEDQRLEVTAPLVDGQRRPYALGRIDSYDFGARATLRVTCELVDGRELVGEFKGEGGEAAQDLIRLPKMNGPGWIATVWKQENGAAALPDADDSEKVAGQQYDGDGYTLYEEYRGWVVDGRRIEGDPKRKDFFVLNLIGADARKGIELFEKVSQLRVHAKLKRTEMSEKTRLMNGNHRDAPRRVRQHGVWVKTFDSVAKLGGTGAFTPLTKAGVSGRPGITVGIGLLTKSHPDSTFNQPHNLPRFFSLLAFDRAIAHELLHSVGVEHHGESDSSLSAQWVSPRNRRNKVGRPYFRELATFKENVLTILSENGHDLATQMMPAYAKQHELLKRWFWDKWIAEGKAFLAARQGYQLELDTPEKYAENELENTIGYSFYGAPVGEPGGQHSGVQDCLMRYYFAQLYPVTGKPGTYYQVTEGTEPFGLELCRARGGTGVNASSHKPQSRYGGTGPNGGNCFSQICPNDAIPPRKL